ncbi:MAG: hypothetical protein JO181_10215 [Solirubrobacterales bacterium]|nr:hypothetical protein [Solirubrobacterales bacterium]
MFDERKPVRGFITGDASARAGRIVIDADPVDRTERLRVRLAELGEERILARECGLAKQPAYMEDLDLEVRETRRAYNGAAVLELALLRGELYGRNEG